MMGRAAEAAEEEGGEGYFASISDLMVGILFVFLLILTVFALNYRDAADPIDQARARLQQDIREREQALATLLDRIAADLRAEGVVVRIDQSSAVLRFTGDVLFGKGNAELNERARRTIRILAGALGRVLPCYTYQVDRSLCGPGTVPILEAVLIEGHTDQEPWENRTAEQSVIENDRLSAARALNVLTEILRHPPVEKLKSGHEAPLFGLSGYGQRRPVAAGTTEAAFAQNRRIDIRFILSSRISDDVHRLLDDVHTQRRPGP